MLSCLPRLNQSCSSPSSNPFYWQSHSWALTLAEASQGHKRHIQLFISLHTRHRIDDNDTMPTCDILVGKALWMLRREHVYWFYCCNWHHQNVSGMQPQAIEHCAIPATLSLFKFYITCLFHKGGLQKTNPSY